MIAQPLKRVAEVWFSNVDKKSVDGQVPVRLCNYTDVYYNDRIVAEMPFMEATATPDQVARFSLRAGDVLLTKDSETADDIGVSALVTQDLPGVLCGYHLAIARPRGNAVDGRFLRWALAASPSRGQLENAATGVTRFGLRQDAVAGMLVPTASLAAQRAIADYLDAQTARIDAVVRAREATIPLLWERYWAAVDTALRDLKRQEGLGRHSLSMTDGPFGSSLTSAHYAPDEDGARVVRLGNIGRGIFQDEDHAFIPWRHFALLKKHDAAADDLVVAGLGDESNPLGRACVLPQNLGPAIVKADCFRFRLDQRRLLPAYAALFLSSPTGGQLMQELARGSTRQRANLGAVASVRVPAPPVERQRETVDLFNVKRAVTARAAGVVQGQVDLLVERRQALITAAVTGQLAIPGVSA